MTAKRYFKRMWEEEYYIFDSNTISESDFEEKLEYQDYKAFEDSMMGDEVVNRLNEQHETNEQLRHDATILIQSNHDYRKENEELKQTNQKLYDDLQTCMSYKSLKMGENSILKKENEQLKCGNKNLKSILNDFINICNRLQANPNDKLTLNVARDMLQNMGKELEE